MGPFPHESSRPRDRLRQFIVDRLPPAHRTKTLSLIMKSTPKAAENVIAGHWPNDLHLAAIVREFGFDLVQILFAPEIEPVLARLTQQEIELERQLEAVRARRRQASGRASGIQGGGCQAGNPADFADHEA